MNIDPDLFSIYNKDTIENQIRLAMLKGKTATIVDQRSDNLGRCRDEVYPEKEVIDYLKRAGFKVSSMYYLDGDEKVPCGYNVKWGNDE